MNNDDMTCCRYSTVFLFSILIFCTFQQHDFSRGFRPQSHSGRSANFVLNDSRKKVIATVVIEPRPLAQESETIQTELTHHFLSVWKFKILIYHALLILIFQKSKVNWCNNNSEFKDPSINTCQVTQSVESLGSLGSMPTVATIFFLPSPYVDR